MGRSHTRHWLLPGEAVRCTPWTTGGDRQHRRSDAESDLVMVVKHRAILDALSLVPHHERVVGRFDRVIGVTGMVLMAFAADILVGAPTW